MDIRGYEDNDYTGVIECLRRNFDVFLDKDDQYMYNWTYYMLHNWREDEIGDRHGVVIEEGGKIFGYLGGFYYSHSYKDKKYTILHTTTWCIDERKRLCLVPAMKKFYEDVDMVIDLTSIQAMISTSMNIFKSHIYNETVSVIPPIPFNGKRRTQIEYVTDEHEIDDYDIRKKFKDHCVFPFIRLIKIRFNEEDSYIFYKLITNNGQWFRILEVTDGKVLAQNTHEIIWNIFEHEIYSNMNAYKLLTNIIEKVYDNQYIGAECDDVFFEGYAPIYPVIKKKRGVRLRRDYSKIEGYRISYMYSEFAILL